MLFICFRGSNENQQILNLQCEYPDVVAKRFTQNGPVRLILARDKANREWKFRADEYEKAKERIEAKIRNENKKLSEKDSFFKLCPAFEVSVVSEFEKRYLLPVKIKRQLLK
jgi:hypothetical protein